MNVIRQWLPKAVLMVAFTGVIGTVIFSTQYHMKEFEPKTAGIVSNDVSQDVNSTKIEKSADVEAVLMNDRKLIEEVKQKFLPANKEQYELQNPSNKYFSQNKQDEFIEKAFKQQKNGLFLEAGAFDGETISNTLFLERNLSWTGVLVEPYSVSFEKMKLKNRKAKMLEACLSPTQTTEELRLEKVRNDPSLFKVLMDGDETETDTTSTVTCYPLYTIIAAMDEPILDVLFLDVEGVEMEVLRTMPWSEVNIRVILIEVNHIAEGESVVRSYMESQGFEYLKKLGVDQVFYDPKLSNELDLS